MAQRFSEPADPLTLREHRRLHAACALKHLKLAWHELIKAVAPKIKKPLPKVGK